MTIATRALASDVVGRPEFARISLRVPRFSLPLSIDHIAPPRERFLPEERAELALALEAHLAPLAPNVAVLDSIRALRVAGACCVVTGQQPGLLGGPLYSLYKALHAVRLARSLSQAWERPVVPLFWNHADDHDIGEVHHAWLLNENLDLQRIGLSGMSSGRQPLSRLVLRDAEHRLVAVREALRQSLIGCEFAEEAIELFAPRDGETLASAFTRSMTDLLGHLGLVVLEPDWIRTPLSRALAGVVQGPVREGLADGETALRALGVEPSIESATAALLFHVDSGGRRALRLGGDGYRYDGEEGSRSSVELAAEIIQSPTDWSPGALLRPLVQDISLPVVAYVGGWGELSYLAQLGPLREALGAPLTAAVPRWSCTLVDDDTNAALERLGLSIANVLSARAVQIESEEPGAAPPFIAELRAIVERTAKELSAHREELAKLDRGLAANLPRTGAQIRTLVEKICEKAERVHANRSGRGKRLVRRVSNNLCPRGELQERVLGALPFVARFGRAWIDELFHALGPFESGHLVVTWNTPQHGSDAGDDET